MAITMQAAQTTEVSPFVLTPLQAGALKRDSGTQTGAIPPERVVMCEGQKVSIYDGVTTLKGKRGSLVVRYRSEYVDDAVEAHLRNEERLLADLPAAKRKQLAALLSDLLIVLGGRRDGGDPATGWPSEQDWRFSGRFRATRT